MIDSDVVWRRLLQGEALDGLGLRRRDGRWDLRAVGQPTYPWTQNDDLPTFRRASLRGLDLSSVRLEHFRFFDCRVDDCVFDGAGLLDWRLWSTSVTRSSFRGCAVDGGMGGDRRRPNEWVGIDFSGVSFRGTAHFMESYVDCDFGDATMRRVDFEGSRHVRSRFAGLLDDCEFRARPKGVKRGKGANTLEGVDFSHATVRFTGFHKLNLGSCTLPTSPDHLKFDDCGHFAQRVLEAIPTSARPHVILRVLMERTRDDALPGGGGPGFRHRLDLGETPEEIADAEALLRACGAF